MLNQRVVRRFVVGRSWRMIVPMKIMCGGIVDSFIVIVCYIWRMIFSFMIVNGLFVNFCIIIIDQIVEIMIMMWRMMERMMKMHSYGGINLKVERRRGQGGN